MFDFVQKNKKTCQFICASDLFENCQGAYNAFSESDPDCSWGDNSRTMIDATKIKDILEDQQDESLNKSVQDQIKTVLDRLQQIIEINLLEWHKDPADPTYVGTTYIDLEN